MALVNTKQLANAMNVTVRRVEQLAHEGLPREDRGRWDLGKCLLWYVRYLQKALERRAVPMSPDGEMAALGDARVRSVSADAALKELELAEKRREMIRLPDVERRWLDIAAVIKARILALPSRITPKILGMSDRTRVETLIAEEVRAALTELSQTHMNHSHHESSPTPAATSPS